MISAVVLAAGAARRFGAVKPLAMLAGQPLVRHVVASMRGDVGEVIVVLAQPDAAFTAALADVHPSVRTVVNARSREGMSRSIRVGLTAMDPRTRAVLIALADQPTIQREVVAALIATWRVDARQIVVPVYRGVRGHPVLFDAAMLPELLSIEGDRGARDIIARDAGRVSLLHVDREAPVDVDTPDVLEALDRALRLARS